MKIPTHRTFCIVALLMAPVCVSSQILPLHYYTAKDGLPFNHVTALHQDSKGYLWIGTEEGLCVYNGVAFKTYTTVDGLPNPYITGIIESRKSPGTIWISTIADGIAKYENGSITAYRYSNAYPRNNSSNLAEDDNGDIWCATSSGIFRLHDDSLRYEAVVPKEYVGNDDVMRSPDGSMWIGFNQSVYVKKSHENSFQSKTLSLHPNAYIHHLTADNDGGVWITATDSTVRQFAGGELVTTWSSSQYGLVYQVMLDRDGDLWMTTEWGLLRMPKKNFPAAQPTVYRFSRNSADRLNPILEDREGDIWFGTWLSGLGKISDKNVIKLPLESNAAGFADRKGHLWALKSHGVWEVWQADNRRWVSEDHVISKSNASNVTLVCTDTRDRLWVWTSDSVLMCDSIIHRADSSSLLKPVFRLRAGKDFAAEFVFVVYVDPRNYLWISAGQGIEVLDLNGNQPRLLSHLKYPADLRDPSVRSIFRDSRGNVWFGGFSYGLDELVAGDLAKKEIRHFTTADGLPDNGVRSMTEDEFGRIWIGTRFGGVSVYDSGKFSNISIKEGLPSNAVWSLAADEGHHVWLGTGIGAVSVNVRDFKDLRHSDVISTEPCGVRYSSATGTLWILTTKEATALPPQRNNNLPLTPPVYISKITFNDRPIGVPVDLELPYDQNNCVIEFVGISFRSENGVRYRFRLKGIDHDWSVPSKNRSVSYASLSPGSYAFEVQAVNDDGVASTTPASFAFSIIPPLWQRWWVQAIGAVLFLSMGPFVYYKRVSRLQREKQMQQEFSRRLIQSQEGERKRIAAELHDSLGQNLLVIQNQALLAMDTPPGEPGIAERLKDISAVTTQTIDEVREIAHDLRPYHLDKLGLTTSIQAIIRRISESTQIAFSSDIDPIDGVFSKEDDSHVYRIVQEGINNIVKHSQATEASISIKKHQNAVIVKIRDNGIGFRKPRTELPNTEETFDGFGLIGLGERVRILNGNISFGSTPGRGTTLMIDIPRSEENHG